MTVRVLIVDDEPLARERLVTLVRDYPDAEVIGECADGATAVRAIIDLLPDLVFLDIEMPEQDGFEVLGALGDDVPAIIFTTAYDKYAVKAFDVDAIDYLLKPVNVARFKAAMARALGHLDRPRSQRTDTLHALVERVERERASRSRFVVRHGNKLVFVKVADVDWMDGAANYVRLHVGGRVHFVRETMKSVEQHLDPAAWLRIHRSVIVRIDQIASIEATSHGEYLVVMRDGARLTASRTHSARLREMLR